MIAVGSCFSQLLSLIDRNGFARAVKQHGAERGPKGFGCWDQFVAMLFCQMGAAHSLREKQMVDRAEAVCGDYENRELQALCEMRLVPLRLQHLSGSSPPLCPNLSDGKVSCFL